MKLFQTLASLALVSAQAPPEPKNCADCIAFDNAYKDECKKNPHLIDDYVNMLKQECSSAGNLQSICETIAGGAFKKYLEKIRDEDSKQYCTEITMCQNSIVRFYQQDDPDCTACLNFMTDLRLIARYDPPHFAQIFDAIVKGLCEETGKFESRVCYQELKGHEEDARKAIMNADQQKVCVQLEYC
ncbi:Oidioi.mRNA.OKI2018_I69.chr2.g5406.t1.cds [Oikopleura dioica]|uniref:Oidioi.mRNA.OKI2018_I69.chr2.g5406.t1.cds n=1 Tax=Oikopleura dioica TaxID=34765 RepID=A0ABN7T072_OIKDI|nr:Oidioi.mRNA.OKI2018_I69.chr2.g5406.t1.cds [Oikopleura dioica]